ncbi:MafI family immunity protein [Streptomyces mirabilis]
MGTRTSSEHLPVGDHLDAARAHPTGLPDIDLSPTLEFLEHNELGPAFDCLVHLGDDLDLPLTFWNHLDQAAREMRLYTDALHKPHLTAADPCRRHLAAACEKASCVSPSSPAQLLVRCPHSPYCSPPPSLSCLNETSRPRSTDQGRLTSLRSPTGPGEPFVWLAHPGVPGVAN